MTAVRTELGRFLTLAGYRYNQGESATPMFSGAIDAAWHELAEDPAAHEAFGIEHAGAVVHHVEGSGEGFVPWVSAYEEAYGPLPVVWFTDADGHVDEAAFTTYQETGRVWASWKCGPEFTPADEATTE
ncbi:hypothetical protein ACFYNW_17370 [Streptomyces virginiae]|uniref:hypothetical protein n=1 Tax=Streptomyces virginiae TaxID=1961 RepID=UPI0036EA6E1B